MRRFVSSGFLVALIALASSCANPDLTATGEDPRLHVVMILEPGADGQFLLVRNIGSGDLEGLSARLTGPSSSEFGMELPLRECVPSMGTIVSVEDAACLRFDSQIASGFEYDLRVNAVGRVGVFATTTVPDSLAVDSVHVGSTAVRVSFGEAWGAAVYVVVLHHGVGGTCRVGEPCTATVTALADRPVVEVAFPDGGLSAPGSWWIEGFAMDAALSRHLATGNGGGLFSVQPQSNVIDGFGVLGSWTRATWWASATPSQ